MKKNLIWLACLLPGLSGIFSQNLKPYIVGFKSDISISETVSSIKYSLAEHDLQVVGSYTPAGDYNRFVIAVTSPSLIHIAGEAGGLRAFGSVLRVAVTREGNQTVVSYTNPEYWENAYFQDEYAKYQNIFDQLADNLKTTMSSCGQFIGQQFGSEDGFTPTELRKYHYMFGMEYFEDVVELNRFDSFDDAIRMIDTNLNKAGSMTNLVYSVEFPGKDLKIYGIALSGETGEEGFLPVIDITRPKHTAFLPYEMLVMGDRVVMMHGRYRIALSFPDLTMMTFGKIMSTPGDIEDLLKSITN